LGQPQETLWRRLLVNRMFLAHLTWPEADQLFAQHPIALWPVGSTEPHGPHLALRTDVIIAEAMAARVHALLSQAALPAVILPSLPFGVTEFGRDFTGALSISPTSLIELIRGVATSLKRDGARLLVLLNAHLEPGQLTALHEAARVATESALPTIFPDKTRKDIARTLSDEFKSGACHAGQYETSLVLAHEPAAVRTELAQQLPSVDISISKAIRAGKTSFKQAGADRAYFGSPSLGSAQEGDEQLTLLAAHVLRDIRQQLGLPE